MAKRLQLDQVEDTDLVPLLDELHAALNANAGRLLTPDERLLVEEVQLYAYALKDEALRDHYLTAFGLPRKPAQSTRPVTKPIELL